MLVHNNQIQLLVCPFPYRKRNSATEKRNKHSSTNHTAVLLAEVLESIGEPLVQSLSFPPLPTEPLPEAQGQGHTLSLEEEGVAGSSPLFLGTLLPPRLGERDTALPKQETMLYREASILETI